MTLTEAEQRAWDSAFGTCWVLTGSKTNRAARRSWCTQVANDAVEAYREAQARPSGSAYPEGFPDPTQRIPDSELEPLFQHSDTWGKPGGKENP